MKVKRRKKMHMIAISSTKRKVNHKSCDAWVLVSKILHTTCLLGEDDFGSSEESGKDWDELEKEAAIGKIQNDKTGATR